MLIIISPTKQMKVNQDKKPKQCPMFINETKQIWNILRTLNVDDIKKLMKINDKLALENIERYQNMKFDENGSCAFDTYQGLQFQYMNIESKSEHQYIENHLRILSGFYGVLRPQDSIYPYRLEMQAGLLINGYKDIYCFWQDKLAKALLNELQSHELPVLINMASKEYEKAVLPYISKDRCVTLTFKIRKKGVLKVESTQAKMARGRMIHYLASHTIETLEGIKGFDEDGYQYDRNLSTDHEYVFVKEGQA